jgi:sortase A
MRPSARRGGPAPGLPPSGAGTASGPSGIGPTDTWCEGGARHAAGRAADKAAAEAAAAAAQAAADDPADAAADVAVGQSGGIHSAFAPPPRPAASTPARVDGVRSGRPTRRTGPITRTGPALGTAATGFIGRTGLARPTSPAAADAPSGLGSGSAGKRVRRWSITLAGALLVWAALGFTAYAVAWQGHKDHAQSVLLQSAQSNIDQVAAQNHGQPCLIAGQQPGQLAGILRVPALNLTAPVEEGTDDSELNVAVGHDPQSVWPGATGAAVFLAHDVSYFVHLNELQSGDVITYQTACTTTRFTVTGQQVVQAGSAVADTPNASMVLDTCYPPNALFYTSQRLLVRATEVSDVTTGSKSLPAKAIASGQAPADTFSAPAPPALVAQGLTLQQNEAPMGTMQLVNAPQSFAQSPGPLNLEAAALEAYFGGLHAGAQHQPTWWADLAPGLAMPSQMNGAAVTGHDAPLNVEIDSTNGVPSQVVLRTTVTMAGGSAPGTHAETVTLPVHGSVVTIGNWQFS